MNAAQLGIAFAAAACVGGAGAYFLNRASARNGSPADSSQVADLVERVEDLEEKLASALAHVEALSAKIESRAGQAQTGQSTLPQPDEKPSSCAYVHRMCRELERDPSRNLLFSAFGGELCQLLAVQASLGRPFEPSQEKACERVAKHLVNTGPSMPGRPARAVFGEIQVEQYDEEYDEDNGEPY